MTASASTATPTGTPFRVEAEHVVIAAGGKPNRSRRTGRPVIVDVNIDYRRRTQMTKGMVKTDRRRFSTSEKIQFVARAAKRHLSG